MTMIASVGSFDHDAHRRSAGPQIDLRMIIENINDVIFLITPDGRAYYVSPSCTKVFGWSPGEMINNAAGLVVPEDRHVIGTAVMAVREGKPVDTRNTFRVLKRDGSTVWVESDTKSFFNQGNQQVELISVVRDIGERKELEEKIFNLVNIDGLTGLYNRRAFDETLQSEWRRALREQAPLSLLLIDVDRFKRFNDRYGHQAGDICLKAIADTLTRVIERPGDLAARYGGEELAVILPNTDENGVIAVADRACAAIRDLKLPHEGNPACGSIVTASIGCATERPAFGRMEETSRLIAEADIRLYEAKRMGRNRVQASFSMSPVADPLSDEEQRLAVYSAYETAGATGPSESLDRIVRIAAQLLDVPIAFVSLVGRDDVIVAGKFGVDWRGGSRHGSFCSHAIQSGEPLIVPNTSEDPRFADNAATRAGMAFYAGMPLLSPLGDHKLGTLCIADTRPRQQLDRAKRELLTDLAQLVVDDLERRRVSPRTGDPRAA